MHWVLNIAGVLPLSCAMSTKHYWGPTTKMYHEYQTLLGTTPKLCHEYSTYMYYWGLTTKVCHNLCKECISFCYKAYISTQFWLVPTAKLCHEYCMLLGWATARSSTVRGPPSRTVYSCWTSPANWGLSRNRKTIYQRQNLWFDEIATFVFKSKIFKDTNL